MESVFAAQRLTRIDVMRRESLTEAAGRGEGATDIVERSIRLELATEYAAGRLIMLADGDHPRGGCGVRMQAGDAPAKKEESEFTDARTHSPHDHVRAIRGVDDHGEGCSQTVDSPRGSPAGCLECGNVGSTDPEGDFDAGLLSQRHRPRSHHLRCRRATVLRKPDDPTLHPSSGDDGGKTEPAHEDDHGDTSDERRPFELAYGTDDDHQRRTGEQFEHASGVARESREPSLRCDESEVAVLGEPELIRPHGHDRSRRSV